MTIQTMMFLFGGLLILVAIVGGGIEVRELKIPRVETKSRVMAATIGAIFIIAAVIYGNGPAEVSAQGSFTRQTTTQSQQPGDIILGVWKEYGYVSSTDQWEYLGTFEVAKVNGSYTVSAREQHESPDILNSIGIFGVQSDSTSWKFNSNWGHGAVGNFNLQRVSDTVFEGDISVEGKVVGRTKWVRIQ